MSVGNRIAIIILEGGRYDRGWTCSTDIYEAVVALTRSIGGRTDLRSLLAGVAEALGRIVTFDHLGLILHDPVGNAMEGHIPERARKPRAHYPATAGR